MNINPDTEWELGEPGVGTSNETSILVLDTKTGNAVAEVFDMEAEDAIVVAPKMLAALNKVVLFVDMELATRGFINDQEYAPEHQAGPLAELLAKIIAEAEGRI